MIRTVSDFRDITQLKSMLCRNLFNFISNKMNYIKDCCY